MVDGDILKIPIEPYTLDYIKELRLTPKEYNKMFIQTLDEVVLRVNNRLRVAVPATYESRSDMHYILEELKIKFYKIYNSIANFIK